MDKTLAEAKKGETLEIVGYSDNNTKYQTMRFGLSIGEKVECIGRVGPIIIEKNMQTIAIGKNLANRIITQAA